MWQLTSLIWNNKTQPKKKNNISLRPSALFSFSVWLPWLITLSAFSFSWNKKSLSFFFSVYSHSHCRLLESSLDCAYQLLGLHFQSYRLNLLGPENRHRHPTEEISIYKRRCDVFILLHFSIHQIMVWDHIWKNYFSKQIYHL